MTTSGTYNFALTTGQSVITAFRRVRVFAPSLSTDHMICAREEMNLLFVEFANKQVNLFKVVLNSIPMVQGTTTYPIPANVVMILDAVISTSQGQASQQDIIVPPLSRTEYMSLSNKATPGRPTSFWFNRTPPAQTVTMWPVPDANGPYFLNYYACIQMQDANLSGGETPDIPYRWLDAFISGLAHRLSRVYAPDLEEKREKDAIKAWTTAAEQDVENVNISFSPNIRPYYR
jgi:hypothetical protein